MKIMKNKNKTNINHKASMIFFGFIIISCVLFALIMVGDIYKKEKLNDEWNYVLITLEQGKDESEKMNNELVDTIQDKVQVTYTDNIALKNDLENIEEVNDLTIILDESVADVYLMGIVNDNNDPFIMNHSKIITDKSFNCSADIGTTRTFEEEIYEAGGDGHFSKALAYKAINSMVNGENKTVIWSFLSVDESLPWYEEVRDLPYVDMTVLKDLFFRYNGDIRVLETFEFLTPVYIYKDKDLLDTRLVNISGHKNPENYQLIGVQGFNITDLMDELGYTKIINSKSIDVYNFLTVLKIVTALIIAIMFSFFFIISRAYNRRLSNNTDAE